MLDGEWMAIDLDGTVANCDHRLKYILNMETGERLPRKERNYEKFFSNCIEDKLILHNAGLIMTNYFWFKYYPVFITGRPEKMMEETVQWIEKNLFTKFDIHMRKDGDYRPDYVTKAELMEAVIREWDRKPVMAFEDRPKVADAWLDIIAPSVVYRATDNGFVEHEREISE